MQLVLFQWCNYSWFRRVSNTVQGTICWGIGADGTRAAFYAKRKRVHVQQWTEKLNSLVQSRWHDTEETFSSLVKHIVSTTPFLRSTFQPSPSTVRVALDQQVTILPSAKLLQNRWGRERSGQQKKLKAFIFLGLIHVFLCVGRVRQGQWIDGSFPKESWGGRNNTLFRQAWLVCQWHFTVQEVIIILLSFSSTTSSSVVSGTLVFSLQCPVASFLYRTFGQSVQCSFSASVFGPKNGKSCLPRAAFLTWHHVCFRSAVCLGHEPWPM